MKNACTTCGYIHAGDDARAVGRFTGTPTYVAAHAGTPPRATRAEAEADECAWRVDRRPPTPVDPPTSETPRPAPEEPTPAPEPFPAATMETAARAKAWCDFLTEIQTSLMVWQIDASVRTGCEDVREWLRRCRDELSEVTA